MRSVSLENSHNKQVNENWQRLSPTSVMFFFIKNLLRLVKESYTALAPMAILVVNTDNKLMWASLLVAAILIFMITAAILQYLFYQYSPQADGIKIKEGVFKKQDRRIPFERLQNVNILQPFYFRPLNLAILQLETAGSTGNEANIAGISLTEAQQLKSAALYKQSENSNIQDSSINQTQSSEAAPIVKASNSDLVKYGLSHNGILWLLVFIAPLTGTIEKHLRAWWKDNQLITQISNWIPENYQVFVALVIIILVMLLSVIILFGFSILGSLIKYHGYQLFYESHRFRRHSGLFSTQEIALKKQKIQALVRQTNFIGRWLKVENLIFKQVTSSTNNKAQQEQFVIPARTTEQSKRIAGLLFDNPKEPDAPHSIDRRYLRKYWLLLMIPPSLLCLLLSLELSFYWSLSWPFLAFLFYRISLRRWKAFAYALKGETAWVKSGFFGYKIIEFSLFKVQRMAIKQSPWQRKAHLATLDIYLASQKISIPYMKCEDAMHWYNLSSAKIETQQQAWY